MVLNRIIGDLEEAGFIDNRRHDDQQRFESNSTLADYMYP